jgi:choline dehydrogenase
MAAWAATRPNPASADAADGFAQFPDRDPRDLADGYDYIVIGSGAGGAPVAARLAEAGHRVLVLEAGSGTVPRELYQIPAYHLRASSNPRMSWDFSVRHYTDRAAHGRAFQPDTDGVLYPRASTIGGCTAHYAMLMTAPPDQDWEHLARVTGDPRFGPEPMAEHARRVRSWLPMEEVPPSLLLRDRGVARMVTAAAVESGVPVPRPGTDIDLNTLAVTGAVPDATDPALVEADRDGLYLITQSTKDGRRRGTRELLLDVARRHPGKLTIQTNALVERIGFSCTTSGAQVATSVTFRHGHHLYRASPDHRAHAGFTRHHVKVDREVVLSGGAFNSPQVLMLSGIGDPDELRRHHIDCVVPISAVGTNLQDRYEMSVVTRHDKDFDIAADCDLLDDDDACARQWRRDPTNAVYRSNGIVIGAKLTVPGADHPEVFVFGSPSRFEGYAPGFAQKGLSRHNYWTWAVLKGWSRNRTGTVRLASADPTRPPKINFRYFDDGHGGKEDLEAVVHGLSFARRVNRRAETLTWLDQNKGTEIFPGPDLGDDSDRLADFVRAEAWGHHASCSNPMGSGRDDRSVVDRRFLVHGTANLRVVDASVFPRIPAMFPALAIFTLAEKAAADMVRAAEQESR